MCPAAASQIDNDGDIDMYVGSAAVQLNNGSGGFAQSVRVQGWNGDACASASFHDVDNDGDVDLFVSGVSRSQLFTNNGSGWFNATTAFGVAGAGVFVDINADGALDLPAVSFINDLPRSPGTRCTPSVLHVLLHVC